MDQFNPKSCLQQQQKPTIITTKLLPQQRILLEIITKFLLNLTYQRQYINSDRLWFHYNQAFNYYIDCIVQKNLAENYTNNRQQLYEGFQPLLPDHLKRQYSELINSCNKINEYAIVAGSIIIDEKTHEVLMVKGGCDARNRGKYGFCKGKIGQQQDFLQCAYRQISQQLRIDPIKAGIKLQPHKYFYGKTDHKQGVFFFCQVDRKRVDFQLGKKEDRDSNPQIQSVQWVNITKLRDYETFQDQKKVQNQRPINFNAISKFIMQRIYQTNPKYQSIRYSRIHSFIKPADKRTQNKGFMNSRDKALSKKMIEKIQSQVRKESNNYSSDQQIIQDGSQSQTRYLTLYTHQKELIQVISQSLKGDQVKPLLVLYTSLNYSGNKILMSTFSKIFKQFKQKFKKSKLAYCSIFKGDKSMIKTFAKANDIEVEFIYIEKYNQKKLNIKDSAQLILSDMYSLNEFLQKQKRYGKQKSSQIDWINSILFIDISVQMYDTDMFKIIQLLSNFPPKIIILQFSYKITQQCKTNISNLIKSVYSNLQIVQIQAEKVYSNQSECYTFDGNVWFPHKGLQNTSSINNLLQCIKNTPKIQNSYGFQCFKNKIKTLLNQYSSQKKIKKQLHQNQDEDNKKFYQELQKCLQALQIPNKTFKIKQFFESFINFKEHEIHISKLSNYQIKNKQKKLERFFNDQKIDTHFLKSDSKRFVDKCIISVKDVQKFTEMLCSQWVQKINISNIRKRISLQDIKYFFESKVEKKQLLKLKKRFYNRVYQKHLYENQKQKIIGSKHYFQKFFKEESNSQFTKKYIQMNHHIHVYDALNPHNKHFNDDFQKRLLFCGIVIYSKATNRDIKKAIQGYIYDDFLSLIITDDLMKALTMNNYRTIIVTDENFCKMQTKSQKQLIPRIFGRKQTETMEKYNIPLETYLGNQTAKICQGYICKQRDFFNTPSYLLMATQFYMNFPNLQLKNQKIQISYSNGSLIENIYISIIDSNQKVNTIQTFQFIFYYLKGSQIYLLIDLQQSEKQKLKLLKKSHNLTYKDLPKIKNQYGLQVIDKNLFYHENYSFISKILKQSLEKIIKQDKYLSNCSYKQNKFDEIIKRFIFTQKKQDYSAIIPIQIQNYKQQSSNKKYEMICIKKSETSQNLQGQDKILVSKILQLIPKKIKQKEQNQCIQFEKNQQQQTQKEYPNPEFRKRILQTTISRPRVGEYQKSESAQRVHRHLALEKASERPKSIKKYRN